MRPDAQSASTAQQMMSLIWVQTSRTPPRRLLYNVCLPSIVIKGYLQPGNLFLTAQKAEKSNIKVLALCQGPIAALTQDERWYGKERKRAGGRERDHSSFYHKLPQQPLINPCKGHGLMSSSPLNGPMASYRCTEGCSQHMGLGGIPLTHSNCVFHPAMVFMEDLHKLSQPSRVTRTRRAEVCDVLSLKAGSLQAMG